MSGSAEKLGTKEDVGRMSTEEISNVLTNVVRSCGAKIDTGQVVLFGEIKPSKQESCFSFNAGSDDQIVLKQDGWFYLPSRGRVSARIQNLKLC